MAETIDEKRWILEKHRKEDQDFCFAMFCILDIMESEMSNKFD